VVDDPEPGDLSDTRFGQRPRVEGSKPLSDAKASQLPAVTLVLGGVRSGKSAYAEALIGARTDAVYIATAEAGDAEMQERIRQHQARRGASWSTVEAPLELTPALIEATAGGRPVLVDCLTLWLSNLMAADRNISAETERLLVTLPGLSGPVVFVSNEVGLGIVPATPLGRAFRDAAGRLNQAVARAAERVVFIAAGLPLILKEPRA
jgi:Adenosyl cobinamide kinase/adenosyl cobinamide phosphate guanylyltransferase